MYSRETIDELNALSKAVFGTSSKWKKIIEKGVHTLYDEDTTRVNTNGTKETVKTARLHVGKNGGELPEYYLNRYTTESVKEFMLNVLVQRQRLQELLKKQKEDEDLKKELAKQTLEESSGSSV
jgi:hypothetical protein